MNMSVRLVPLRAISRNIRSTHFIGSARQNREALPTICQVFAHATHHELLNTSLELASFSLLFRQILKLAGTVKFSYNRRIVWIFTAVASIDGAMSILTSIKPADIGRHWTVHLTVFGPNKWIKKRAPYAQQSVIIHTRPHFRYNKTFCFALRIEPLNISYIYPFQFSIVSPTTFLSPYLRKYPIHIVDNVKYYIYFQ